MDSTENDYTGLSFCFEMKLRAIGLASFIKLAQSRLSFIQPNVLRMSSSNKKCKLNPVNASTGESESENVHQASSYIDYLSGSDTDINSSNALNSYIRLNNGVKMPTIGFGTYKMKNDLVKPMVTTALESGYRLVDTAHVYKGGKTETHIGDALATLFGEEMDNPDESKHPFILTKVWRSWHGYEDTKICLRRSLKRLKIKQADLVLIHWPGPGYKTINRSKELIEKYGVEYYIKEGHEDYAKLRLETWRALEDAVLKTKQCRSIGVSNFTIEHLKKLLEWKDLRVKPAVNQIEMHPYYPQTELRKFCQENDITVQAYSSLGGQDSSSIDYNERLKQPPLLKNPVVIKIASEVKKTTAQILLRWAIQHGASVIPKASSRERILENIKILDFSLSKKQMDALDGLDCGVAGRLTWRRDPMRNLEFQ